MTSKYKAAFLALFLLVGVPQIISAYEITGDTVYEDTPKAYISARPHTINQSGYVYFTVKSKTYSGNVNVVWGFDTSIHQPKNLQYYNGAGWVDISDHVESIDINYDGKDKWYYVPDVSVNAGDIYYLRAWINITRCWPDDWESSCRKQGKYDFAVYPSSMTPAEAISSGNFMMLDPWWDTDWGFKIPINLSTAEGTTNAPYEIRIVLNSSNAPGNYTFATECNVALNNTTRTRFTNGTENIVLDHWVENCNTTEMVVWVEVDQNITTTNTTIYMYYANPTADFRTNGTNTFRFFDAFFGPTLDAGKWITHAGAPSISAGLLVLNNDWVYSNINFTYLRMKTRLRPQASTGGEIGFFYLDSAIDSGVYQYIGGPLMRYIACDSSVCGLGTHAWTTNVMDNVQIDWNFTNVSFRYKELFRGELDDEPDVELPINLRSTNANIMNVDWILVAQRHEPEPIVWLNAEERFTNPVNVTIYEEINGSLYDMTEIDNAELSVFCGDRTLTFNITANSQIANIADCASYLQWRLEIINGTDTHFRTLIPDITETSVDFYMISAGEFENMIEQKWITYDITARFSNGTVIISKIITDIGERTVIEQTIDTENKVILFLIEGETYRFRVISEDGTDTRDLGTYLTDSDTTKRLTISQVEFNPALNLVMSNVFYQITQDAENEFIRFYYNDTLNQTTLLEVWVYNASNRSQLMFSSTSTSDTAIITYNNVNINQTYIAELRITHDTLGIVNYNRIIDFGYATSVHFLGLTGDEVRWEGIAAIAVIVFTMLVFGARNSHIGFGLVILEVIMFWMWGWFQQFPGINVGLILLLVLAMILGIAERRRNT